ncbi:MAG: 16S rRNA (cytidine(1402)-2'-O)-methyltransferase [Candidatus Levyibacteriota bacterium]|nr:MAG: 16S rRNA (cytidine(1402)-2'-O)-methyltransferase [Candidatus Levybacteria bacterium]
MGTLYIVATPIGNLQDITLRAIEILQTVDVIVCEDTRRTGNLLTNFQFSIFNFQKNPNKPKPRLISYYEQNEMQRIPEIMAFLKNGMNVALVSDAGTPTISDPGFKLVRLCIQEEVRVESIPGPSSVISALVSSGLPTDKFLFVGYPPKKKGHRKKLITDLLALSIKTTIILFEAPHRLVKTLGEMQEIFGNIDVVVARELTKIHEEVRREKISDSIIHFEKTNPRGEFVILFSYERN